MDAARAVRPSLDLASREEPRHVTSLCPLVVLLSWIILSIHRDQTANFLVICTAICIIIVKTFTGVDTFSRE